MNQKSRTKNARGSTKPNGLSKAARRLGISRQRVWQIRRKREGRCIICGKKATQVIGYCKFHRAMRNRIESEGFHRRKALKTDGQR